MMNTWLEKNKKGTFKFTGLVDPSDTTVVTPQATVDYGYNWFSISEGPAILTTPTYDKFLSVSVFDMKHNVPAVITTQQSRSCSSDPARRSPQVLQCHESNGQPKQDEKSRATATEIPEASTHPHRGEEIDQQEIS